MKSNFPLLSLIHISLYLLFILVSVECSIKPHQVPKTMQGRIFVTGNEPFTQLAIEVSPQEVYLISKDSPDYRALWKLQGKMVKLTYTPVGKTQSQILVKSYQLLKK